MFWSTPQLSLVIPGCLLTGHHEEGSSSYMREWNGVGSSSALFWSCIIFQLISDPWILLSFLVSIPSSSCRVVAQLLSEDENAYRAVIEVAVWCKAEIIKLESCSRTFSTAISFRLNRDTTTCMAECILVGTTKWARCGTVQQQRDVIHSSSKGQK